MKRKSVHNPYPPEAVSHDYFQHPSEHDLLTLSSISLPVGCLQDLSTGQDQIYSSLSDDKNSVFVRA